MREHRRTVDRNVRPALGAVKLRRLRAADLDAFYSSLIARGLSPSSVGRTHAVVSAALAQAVKWDLLDVNPATKASAVRQASTDATAPTVDEVRAAIATAETDDPDSASPIALAAVTGARRGELLGLHWDDWDEAGALLHVRRALITVPGGTLEKLPKSARTRRVACSIRSP